MTSRRPTLLALGVLLAWVLAACVPGSAPSASPSATPAGPDFTKPGIAAAMVNQLLAKTGSRLALMVEITEDTVEVSVLDADSTPITWAYRSGQIATIPSDLAYVDQATFDISRFNISDVGALFRAAAGMSGSEESQSLTIVDYSGGEVMMSVSTVPESRTVFFNPDGSLMETLDFDTPGGVARGISAAVGVRMMVYSVTVQSSQGAWVDYPGSNDTVVRRTRTAKVPVTTNIRSENVDLPLFSVSQVAPAAIWAVVDAQRGTGEIPREADWSVVIDDREHHGVPRMHFTIGSKVLVTDLAGTEVNG